jgi:hypothetical protein
MGPLPGSMTAVRVICWLSSGVAFEALMETLGAGGSLTVKEVDA